MSHDVSLGCSHPSEGKTEAGEPASKMAHWQVGPGSWQNASCPCYVGLPTGFSKVHRIEYLASHRVNIPRESQEEVVMSFVTDLASEDTHHYF